MKNMIKDKRLTSFQLMNISDQLGEHIKNVRPQVWKDIFAILIENKYFRMAMLSYIKNYYPEYAMKSDLLELGYYEHTKEE